MRQAGKDSYTVKHTMRVPAYFIFGIALFAVAFISGCGGGGVDIGGVVSQVSSAGGDKSLSVADEDATEGVSKSLAAPPNFNISCCLYDSITVSWEAIPDQNNEGYRLYSCTESECRVAFKEFYDTSILEYTMEPLSVGVEYCYAISGISSDPEQEEEISDIVCGTISETLPRVALISPYNNTTIDSSSLTFVFGFFDEYYSVQYFLLTVKDKYNQIVMQKQIQPFEMSDEPGKYYVDFSGDAELVDGDSYTWSVTGYATKPNYFFGSPTHTFEYQKTITY